MGDKVEFSKPPKDLEVDATSVPAAPTEPAKKGTQKKRAAASGMPQDKAQGKKYRRIQDILKKTGFAEESTAVKNFIDDGDAPDASSYVPSSEVTRAIWDDFLSQIERCFGDQPSTLR